MDGVHVALERETRRETSGAFGAAISVVDRDLRGTADNATAAADGDAAFGRAGQSPVGEARLIVGCRGIFDGGSGQFGRGADLLRWWRLLLLLLLLLMTGVVF